MKYFNKSLVLVVMALLAFSCTNIYEDGKEMASVAAKKIQHISVDSLNAKIERGDDFYLIDVREPDEYAKGSIPGSFSIPRGVLEFKISDEPFWEEEFMYVPEKDNEIVVYCKSGGRASLAALALKQLGFTNVKNLDGGWDAFHGDNPDTGATSSEGGCGG